MTEAFEPFRRRVVDGYNAAADLAARAGLEIDLTADTLRRKASKRAGVPWSADAQSEEALDVLCDSLIREARLSHFGAQIIRARMLGILTTRLRVARLLVDQPEIAQRPIRPPIVIAGLQRSGTTMLHRLIGADPRMRAVGSWEVVHPLPSRWEPGGRPWLRIAATKGAEVALDYLNPRFAAIHAVEADAPEEDVLLQEYSLLSQVPEAMVNVPSYAAWLAGQDMRGSYDYLKLLLQVLAAQRDAPYWVLKTPAHLEHLDTLLEVFPDALIVQTHRDPVATTASFSSMLAHGHSMFSDDIDAEAIARHWLARNVDMVNRALAVRRDRPEKFLDIDYRALVDDPMAAVARIYDRVGLALPGEVREQLERHRAANRQHSRGVHRYSLAQFGLAEAEVRAAYADYRAAFDLS